MRDRALDVRHGVAADDVGEVVRLAYGPGATITRLNKGLRRRATRTQLGFRIDPVSGYWAKNEEEGEGPTDPTASPRQWIVPIVQDRKNALLLQPATQQLSQTALATFQHALLRGIEAVFQLEEGEILAEPMPSRDERNGFLLYEATEGGAGVLTRLVAEPATVAEVAFTALGIMHFDLSDPAALPSDARDLADAAETSCVAACYRCLMSYFNQPDHELIDRRNDEVRTLLLRLARSTTTGLDPSSRARSNTEEQTPPTRGAALARWLEQARLRELPSPDAEPLTLNESRIPLVWREHYVAALLDEEVATMKSALEGRGFEVLVFATPEAEWPTSFTRLAAALGRAS
jgi:hypothetical protein